MNRLWILKFHVEGEGRKTTTPILVDFILQKEEKEGVPQMHPFADGPTMFVFLKLLN